MTDDILARGRGVVTAGELFENFVDDSYELTQEAFTDVPNSTHVLLCALSVSLDWPLSSSPKATL